MQHKVKSCALADFNAVNKENKESCQGKRFSERLSFTRFCANGNRPAFIGGGSERDETLRSEGSERLAFEERFSDFVFATSRLATKLT